MPIDKYDFEKYPEGMPMDETDVNLRSYFARMDDAKLAQYDPDWTDEQVMEWAGDFTNEGTLFLICSERDVNVTEFREVLHQFLEFLQLQKV